MSKYFFSFIARLFALLSFAFICHAWLQHALNVGFFQKQISVNYAFNFIVTTLFFLIFLIAKDKKQTNLGVLFLYSSLIKFLLFFLLIFPNYGHFNGVKSAEFASFFVPYALSVSVEIYFLARILKN